MTIIKAILLGSLIAVMTPARASSDAGQLAFMAKDYSQATSLFEKQLEQNENNVVAYLYLAKIAVKKEDLDLAEEHILEAGELIEDNSEKALDKNIQGEVFHWLGSIMEMQAEKSSIFSMSRYAKQSLKGYLKSVELLPEKLQYREGLINFYLGAPSLLGGDIDKAIKHAKITFDQNPNFGFKMLVNSYEKNGDTQLVLATYKLAIEKYPLDAELLLMRGTYWKTEGNYDSAKMVEDLKVLASPHAINSSLQTAIRNGVDTERFTFIDKGECRERLKIATSQKIVFSVGSLIHRKGFEPPNWRNPYHSQGMFCSGPDIQS